MSDERAAHHPTSNSRRSTSSSLQPPGPPMPTGKTLDEIQPAIPVNVVNTPGDDWFVHRIGGGGAVYYLTGDIDADVSGIQISALRPVTLDLNGFTIRGSSSSLYGISASSANHSILTIRNGRITGFGSGGIRVPSHPALAIQAAVFLENLTITNCGMGIEVVPNVTIRNCRVENNVGRGMSVQAARIDNTRVCGNGDRGIHSTYGAHMTRCIVNRNGEEGVSIDWKLGVGSTISGCIAHGNGGDGFSVREVGATFEHCIASGNGTAGIRAVLHSRIRRCLCRNNRSDSGDSAGIFAWTSFVEENLCVGNNRGIVGVDQSRIQRNACSGNDVNWDMSQGAGAVVVEAAKMDAIDTGSPFVLPEETTLGSMDARVNYTF